MPKKKPKKGKPEVHEELKGFEIKINEFGEIISNFEVDQINEFLDEKVDDKKLRSHDTHRPAEEETHEDDRDDDEE